jgi:chemotaxis protein MotB
MSRHRRRRANANHERWLVSYADFITLLFAFFVVLYASTRVDDKKIVQVSAAIQGAFQQLGAFSGSPDKAHPQPNALPSAGAIPGLEPGGGTTAVDVDHLRHELEEALGEEIANHEIQMHATPEGLVVSLSEVGFFNSGDATLLQGGKSTLTRIASVLNKKGFQIRVEGHTDNVPIHTRKFKSNWELSTARATEVVSLLVERYGLDPQQISAAGYSEYHPVTSNVTDEGRKANRRVDLIVVSRNYHPGEATKPATSP